VAPFGVIPIELDEVYPLSQYETALPPSKETREYVTHQITDYINRTHYHKIILIHDPENWGATVINECRKTCRQKRIELRTLDIKKVLATKARVESVNDIPEKPA
jgi:predicted RNA-binding protein